MELEDKVINCIECGEEFVLTVRDQTFHNEHGHIQPKRCKDCRRLRRQGLTSKGDDIYGKKNY